MKIVQSSLSELPREWARVNTHQVCPVCSRSKGCMIATDGTVLCIKHPSDLPVREGVGIGGWIHPADSNRPAPSFLIPLVPSARRAQPAALHAVYTTLLGQHTLLDRHRRQLREDRKLSAEAIARRGYKSWGAEKHLRSHYARLARELHGSDAVDTPGIIVRRQNGKDYLTLSGAAALAIPVQDPDGQLLGVQLRLDNPAASKYTWLSSGSQGGAKAGTPVHVSRPLKHTRAPGRVWLTEGPLKADISSDILGQIVLAVPGVNSLKQLPATLERLRERGELRELVVAFDSDWHENETVATWRKKAAEMIARMGIPVLLADWTTDRKGLDDLLQHGIRPDLEPYQVHGAGPRLLEVGPAPAARSPQEPRFTLEQARERQDQFIWDAFNAPRGGEDTGYLLRTLPGSGKSHALTRAANRFAKNKNKRQPPISIFVPRHEMGDEPGRENWRRVRGRTHSSKDGSPCAHPEKQSRLVALRVAGQSGCEHCPEQKICRNNTTPGNGQPFYLNQFEKRPPVTLYPAQHLSTPSLWANAGIVALDDCDLLSLCLENVQLSRADLESALRWAEQHEDHPYVQAQPLLFLLDQLLRTVPVDHFEWSGEALLSRLDALARERGIKLEDALRQALLAAEPDPFGSHDLLRSPLDVPRRFILELAKVLRHELQQYRARDEREQRGWNRRVRLERSRDNDDVRLQLTLRRELPLAQLRGKTLLVLDASMTLEEARLLFPDRRWRELDLKVAMPRSVTIHQYPDQNFGITRLRNPDVQDQALGHIRTILERHPNEKVAVLTHKPFATVLKKQLGSRVEVGHFYGQRGSNRFADCTVQITFGTPFPNMEQVQHQAEALHWDGPTLNPGVILQSQPHLGRPGDPTYLSPVRTYVDPRLQRMSRSKSTDELVQAVYRLRPLSVDSAWLEQNVQLDLFADAPKPESDQRTRATVYIFSGMPLPDLEVELHPPEKRRATVLDLTSAAGRLRAARLRLTVARLAKNASTTPAQVRRWIGTLVPLRGRLGALTPPSQAPPAERAAS